MVSHLIFVNKIGILLMYSPFSFGSKTEQLAQQKNSTQFKRVSPLEKNQKFEGNKFNWPLIALTLDFNKLIVYRPIISSNFCVRGYYAKLSRLRCE